MPKAPPPDYTLYGIRYKGTVNKAHALTSLINLGGELWVDGEKRNIPLFDLYRDLQSFLWPDDDHHEWSDLMLKTILEERITVVQGPKDCGKTHGMAKFALCDYFSFPNETLMLMSSTDLRGLELRVWGDLKDLYSRAREVWPTVPGYPLDSLYGIFTDRLQEDTDIRDIRKGIICIPCLESSQAWSSGLVKYTGIKQKRRRLLGDECFPAGTMVDTPCGQKKIEAIVPGDKVLNCIGDDTVLGVRRSTAKSLCRIRLKDGRQIYCTPNHEFLTHAGWKKAVDINCEHYMVSTYEAMSILWSLSAKRWEASIVRVMPKQAKDLPILWKGISSLTSCITANLLFQELQAKMANDSTRISGTVLLSEQKREVESLQTPVAQRSSRVCGSAFCMDEAEQPDEGPCQQSQRERINTQKKQLGKSNKCRKRIAGYAERRRSEMESCVCHQEQDSSMVVHCRHSTSTPEVDCRGRRTKSFQSKGERKGPKKGRILWGDWVESVKILKPSDFETSRTSAESVAVYNLHIEKHHSYSVNDLVVSNCQFMEPPYLTALANINKGDFKGCFVGNPIGEGDPLDKLAEPVNGWDDLLELTVTTTWRNRMGGITINLVGSDSPAIRHPGKFKYLINQKDIDYIASYWGKESAEWWNQAMGLRRPGISLKKVITRDMAKLFGATDPVVWSPGERKRVYGIDAGYGGDRCIGGFVEFGKDLNGRLVLAVNPPHVIPIRVYPSSVPDEERKLPEDQIAEYVKAECEKFEIPAANVFHDATGRGSLGSAFARVWRHDTNPVEFGGKPTPRPILTDLYVYDEKLKQKRLKRADEHFVNKMSELWFAVRYCIEGRQMRELPGDVLEELCSRQFDWKREYKIQVEPKVETKERLGRSPDKADWLAVAMEGARRLGFTINRMEPPVSANDPDPDDRWKQVMKRRVDRLKASYTLTTA